MTVQTNDHQTLTMIDRPGTDNIKVFDRMSTELSPYMSPFEVEKVVEFMQKISGSKFDINPSVEDSKTQLQMILGQDRYKEIEMKWTMANQKLITPYGRRKYKKTDSTDKTLFDGLDPEDDPKDFTQVFV